MDRSDFVAISLVLAALGIAAHGAEPLKSLVLSDDRFEAVFSRENGALVRLSQKGHQGVILRSSESGLWQARLTDNTRIDAASFSTTSAQRQFRWENDALAQHAVHELSQPWAHGHCDRDLP